MAVVLDRYEVHLREKGNRSSSIATTMTRLRGLLPANSALVDCTPAVLRRIYAARAKTVAGDTGRNELAEVKTFWRWAVKGRLVKTSPAEGIEAQGKRRHGKVQLRIDEVQRWWEVALRAASAGDVGAVAALWRGGSCG